MVSYGVLTIFATTVLFELSLQDEKVKSLFLVSTAVKKRTAPRCWETLSDKTPTVWLVFLWKGRKLQLWWWHEHFSNWPLPLPAVCVCECVCVVLWGCECCSLCYLRVLISWICLSDRLSGAVHIMSNQSIGG